MNHHFACSTKALTLSKITIYHIPELIDRNSTSGSTPPHRATSNWFSLWFMQSTRMALTAFTRTSSNSDSKVETRAARAPWVTRSSWLSPVHPRSDRTMAARALMSSSRQPRRLMRMGPALAEVRAWHTWRCSEMLHSTDTAMALMALLSSTSRFTRAGIPSDNTHTVK